MTTRSWQDLMALCVAEYRFWASGLQNFRTVQQHGTSDLGRYLGGLGAFIPNEFDQPDGSAAAFATPKQGMELGYPCVNVDDNFAAFNIPAILQVANNGDFALEYIGVPRAANNQGPGAAGPVDNRITLMSWGDDHYVTLGSNITTDMNLPRILWGGVGEISGENGTWWRPDHPLHLVVTRHVVTGDPSVSTWYMWLNGTIVRWFNGGDDAGSDGWPSPDGLLFNLDSQVDPEPFCGGHFQIRKWNILLEADDVNRLWQRAKLQFAQFMWPQPATWEAPA